MINPPTDQKEAINKIYEFMFQAFASGVVKYAFGIDTLVFSVDKSVDAESRAVIDNFLDGRFPGCRIIVVDDLHSLKEVQAL